MGQHREGSDTAMKDHVISKVAQNTLWLNPYLMLRIFPSYLHLATHQINYEATAKALMKQNTCVTLTEHHSTYFRNKLFKEGKQLWGRRLRQQK